MKKLFLSLALIAAMLLACTAFADDGITHEITSESFPMYMMGADTGETQTLYFLDGVKDMPYLEIHGIYDLLKSFLADANKGIDLTIETDGSLVTITRQHPDAMDNGIFAVFDFYDETIEFMDYNLFLMKSDASTVLDVTGLTFFNAAGEPSLMQKVDTGSLDRVGNAVVLPLGEYGINMITQDGLYLIPLQTFTDFFLAPSLGYNFFYNGQVLILADQIIPGDELYYAAPTGERSEQLVKFGYGELCMMLDYLYGKKDTHEIESFDELFHNVGFDQGLKDYGVEIADKAIYRMLNEYLDDNHTAWHAFSYLTGSIDYEPPMGISDARLRQTAKMYWGARDEFYPDGVPGYEEVGNTAYITFDHFSLEGNMDPEYFYSVEDPNDFDDANTIGLIIKAHAMITRENSPIENVVLDLSGNTGDAADTAIFTLAWLLGDASLGMKDTMTGAMTTSTYRADVNRNRVFDEKDTVTDKKLYCLISPLSFSCGNLVPCILKESGIVTLLGRTSGGGSNVVQNVSSPWGTSFQISGRQRISFLKNGSFYDVDRGADPDFVLTSPEKYYDRQALTDYINNLY